MLEQTEPRKQILKVLDYDKAIAEKLNLNYNYSGKIWFENNKNDKE